MAEERESPLERARKKLYVPGGAFDVTPRPLSVREKNVPRGWENAPIPPKKPAGRKLSGAMKFLIAGAAFFGLAIIATVILLLAGGRSVSSDRVNIDIEGPSTIAGGDIVPLLITVENRNPVTLESATISVDFPEGAYDAEQTDQPLTHYTDKLGNLAPGATVSRTVRAVMFGGENRVVTIPVTVEYRAEGSSAVFVKKEDYQFTIGTSPVSVNVTALSEVPSGQEITLRVNVRSNAPTPLENVAVLASYPFGFSPSSASPEPVSGTLFSLGTLDPGEEEEIVVTGRLTGSENDERVFRFTVGTAREDRSPNLAVSYISKDAEVTIRRAFLAVNLSIDRQETDVVVIPAGQLTSATLSWMNTLPTPILDAELSVKLSGAAFDPDSVVAGNGFFRSSDNTVLFNRETNSSLASLQPGDSGLGTFSFATKSGASLALLRNPSLTLTVSVSGRRVGEAGVPETVTSTLTRTIKVSTELGLSARAVRTVGSIENYGPWPPVANQATSYTVIFTASNSVNSVADAVVTATLPSYVRFTGVVSPAGSVTYNSASRTVYWNVGEIPAGSSPRQAAFQVELTPSTSQRGSSPTLVTSPTLTGFDRFVQKQIQSSAASLDTRVTSDPAYQATYGDVQ